MDSLANSAICSVMRFVEPSTCMRNSDTETISGYEAIFMFVQSQMKLEIRKI